MQRASCETISFGEKGKWWYYYHAKTQKGRFEVFHFLEWLGWIGAGIAGLEVVLYLWLHA